MSGGSVCLSVLGGFTFVDESDGISDLLNNSTTDRGDATDNVEHITDLKVSDNDNPSNSSVIRRTDKIFSHDPIEENVTPSSSASELKRSQELIRKPLETIVEEDEENYGKKKRKRLKTAAELLEEGYDGDMDCNNETDSDEESEINYQPPAPYSAATSIGPGFSSSHIDSEGRFNTLDDLDEEQDPETLDRTPAGRGIKIEGTFYPSNEKETSSDCGIKIDETSYRSD